MNTEEQIKELLYSLQDRTHINTLADMCAERAQGYADSSYYAAAYATHIAAAAHAADYDKERELQLTHLKELHAREENPTKD